MSSHSDVSGRLALTPDVRPFEEARDALQACIDSIHLDGPKGGMWGQSFGYDVRRAQQKCDELFGRKPEPTGFLPRIMWVLRRDG